MKNNSAILLIEFQNQWTKKGLYNWLIKKQLNSRNVISNTINLVKNARNNWIKIIHAPLIIDPNNKKWWLAFLTFGKIFTKWTWKSEISNEVFENWDLIVKWRYSFDAFIGSDLENILKENNIENVFVCWFTTDQCVAKTIKTAINKKFSPFLVSDCTATFNDFFQKRTEKKLKNIINSKGII